MMTEVKERPILFSGPMVKAILDGRKTQTRRIAKEFVDNELSTAMTRRWPQQKGCPYGEPGERLWVREAWAPASAALPLAEGVLYRADYHTSLEKRYGDQKWKPSIHMKRVDSRINLEITGIRVERLNDISVEDAIAEGIEPVRYIWKLYGERVLGSADATGQPRKSYASLWQSINGPGSWAANPLVWVVEFRKV